MENHLYMACIWPVAKTEKIEMAEAALRQTGNIMYTRDVALTYLGMKNFMIQIYGHQAWAGTIENRFRGIAGKVDLCYCPGKPLKTYVFEAPSLSAVLAVKRKIRRIFGIGKSSIHISDNWKETRDMIRLLYHKSSVDALNFSHPYWYPEGSGSTKKARISVIVPVYNVEKYVERCVESVLSQTYGDFELILVDDGSTDASGELCDRLKAADSRILVLHQKNKGLSAARNRGLSAATGDYIAYIDSDDYVEPSYLEVLYQNAVKYQADVSVCGFQTVWEKQKVRPKQNEVKGVKEYSGKKAAGEIVAGNRRSMITAWGKLYHHSIKSLLVYPEGKLHEDEFVTYKVFYEASKVVVTKQPLYCYLQRKESITNDGFCRKRLDKLVALKEAIAFFENKKEMELTAYAVKRYLLNLQIAWYRVKKYLPEEKFIQEQLRREWKRVYQQKKADIVKISSFVDLVSIFVYRIMPDLYCVVAEIVNQILPYD